MAEQRPATSRVWPVVAGTTALAILTGLIVWLTVARGCDGSLSLTVAAAPELAPALRESIDKWVRTEPAVSGTCIKPHVTGVDPARMTAAASAQISGDLDLAGVDSGGTDIPDAWIPDSTTWVTRLRTVDRQAVADATPSVAMSPVVLALPESTARAEGWPAKQIGWDYVLAGMQASPPLQVGIVEPRRSATGLSALLVTGQLATSAAKIAGKDEETAMLGTFRGLSFARVATSDALLGKLPDEPGTEQDGIFCGLLSEREVREYDATKPAVPLAAVYPEPAAPALDYPYTTFAGLSVAKSEAAGELRKWLQTRDSRAVLTRHGFRTPDGAVGPRFPTGHGVSPEPVTPPKPISADAIDRALGLWTEVSMASRALAILDVSGSMNTPVPTAGGLSRLEVTRRAATAGLKLFTDDSELGLWVFSTQLDGDKDYRELVPVGPLETNRGKIADALKHGTAKPGGGTALFDTIRDAYKQMVAEFDPEMSNSIVVMTDGKNQDPDGLSEKQLIAELQRLSKPDKPVHVIVIGIGTEVDKHELETVAKATGGGVFLAPDPSKIGEIFLRALALPSR